LKRTKAYQAHHAPTPMKPMAHMSPKSHKKSDTLRILGWRLRDGAFASVRPRPGLA